MVRSSDFSFPSSADSPSAFRTVLYVEDKPANMDLVAKILWRRSDLRLLTAGNGKTGARLASDACPDVILLDINLHDINGMELFRLLRENAETKNIPVVALSANAFPQQIQLGLEAGFFSYLTKPFKIDDFLDTLDSALFFGEALQRRIRLDLPQQDNMGAVYR
jgi:CheY-like chemotaxis protein